MKQDHYRVLGVSPQASHDEIRRSYLRLVKLHHPDTADANKGGNADHFKAVASAWEILGDKTNRAIYDEMSGDLPLRSQAGGAHFYPGGNTAGSRWREPPRRGPSRMPPIFRAFEIITHPRVVMVAAPLFFVGLVLTGTGREHVDGGVEHKVEAWLNPKTNRWEVPAPWNEEFRKRRHLVQKVNRDIVYSSDE